MNVKNTKKQSKTNWNKLKKIQDEEIDYSDVPELTSSFFKKAELRLPEPKSTITIRIDPDVLKWFKKQGKGYQTRINAILRLYMASKHPPIHS